MPFLIVKPIFFELLFVAIPLAFISIYKKSA